MGRIAGVRIAVERTVIVVDDGDGRGGRTVGADGGHREHDLVELDRRGFDGVDSLATAACDQDIGLLAGGHLRDRGDVGTGAVRAIDMLDKDLDVGPLKSILDTGRRRSKGALTADQGDLLGTELRQRGGELVEAVLANRIITHSDGAHTEPSFAW